MDANTEDTFNNFISEWTQREAKDLDSKDQLKDLRTKFFIPPGIKAREKIYFCGNSLGLQPRIVPDLVSMALNAWRILGVQGHFTTLEKGCDSESINNVIPCWMELDDACSKSMAKLVGAYEEEVGTMNTLTINLNMMLRSFYKPGDGKFKLLIEDQAFISDLDAFHALVKRHGYKPTEALVSITCREILERAEAIAMDELDAVSQMHDINEALLARFEDILRKDQSICGVVMGGVHYATGYVWPMARLSALAHKYNCWIGLDLAHAIGNVIIHLHDWQVDWAVWCTYKYLNAGPGSPGGLFAHKKHIDNGLFPESRGWYGRKAEARFSDKKISDQYFNENEWCDGAARFRQSNPPILALVPLYASLKYIFDPILMGDLVKKSMELNLYLRKGLHMVIRILKLKSEVVILTPHLHLDGISRKIVPETGSGCQTSIRCKHPRIKDWHIELEKLLREEYDVIIDARGPDIIRISPVPIYNTFEEVYWFVRYFYDVLSGFKKD